MRTTGRTQNDIIVKQTLGTTQQTERNVSVVSNKVVIHLNYSGYNFVARAICSKLLFTVKTPDGNNEYFRVNRLNAFLN